MRRNVTDSIMSKINDVLDFPLTRISPESFHDLLINGTYADYLEEFKDYQYRRVKNTHFYFRKGMEKKYDTINSGLEYMLYETAMDATDTALLDNFYSSHRSLIQSVLKISVENESDVELYNSRRKILKKLMKA